MPHKCVLIAERDVPALSKLFSLFGTMYLMTKFNLDLHPEVSNPVGVPFLGPRTEKSILPYTSFNGSHVQWMGGIVPPFEALLRHYRALALAALGYDVLDVLEGLDQTQAADPNDRGIARSIYVVRQELENGNDLDEIYSPKYQERFQELVPVPVVTNAASATVADERLLLRHLGYNGNFLEEIEKTTSKVERKDYVISDIPDRRGCKCLRASAWVCRSEITGSLLMVCL